MSQPSTMANGSYFRFDDDNKLKYTYLQWSWCHITPPGISELRYDALYACKSIEIDRCYLAPVNISFQWLLINACTVGNPRINWTLFTNYDLIWFKCGHEGHWYMRIYFFLYDRVVLINIYLFPLLYLYFRLMPFYYTQHGHIGQPVEKNVYATHWIHTPISGGNL